MNIFQEGVGAVSPPHAPALPSPSLAVTLLGQYPWETTSLGPRSSWSATLNAAVDLILRAPLPMVTLWGPDGVMIYNDGYAVVAAGRHPLLFGSKVLEGWPEVADFNRQILDVCFRQGRHLSFHDQHLVLHRNKSPENVWLDLYYSPVCNPMGTPEGVLAVVVETTQRVLAEQKRRETENALIASEERFRAAFTHAVTGLCLTDLSGRFIRANAAFCQITGYTERELQQRNLFSITHPDDLAHKRALIDQMLSGGIPAFVVEKRYLRRDGSVVWVQNSVSLARDAEGQPANIIIISQDITERKLAEQNLLRSNEELQSFAYAASHELQEPLRTITSFTQLLARRYQGELGDEADALIATIVEGGRRMESLVTELLGYSKAGFIDGIVTQTVDLRTLAESVIQDLRVAIEESGAVIHALNLPTVQANTNQLYQLLQNLLVNAIKYRKPGVPPVITVSAAASSREWQISVIDNGIGFRQDQAAQIFEVFRRLHGRDVPGTGIGLSLCKRIVERHNGRIWAQATPGQGAVFHFTLPISD